VPYWRLHYHLVWATWERAPLITPNVERVVHQTAFAKARELGLVLHAVGGVADHVHLVASIPPTRAVAEIVKQMKGASSRAVHLSAGADFRWQEGYGALTLGGASLARVIEYVRRQKEHHSSGTITAVYETVAEPGE
jgi:putative transposase